MKALLTLMIALVAFWVAKTIYLTYRAAEKETARSEQTTAPTAPTAPASNLPGLPPNLEASLATAEKQGAAGLRSWLNTYRSFVRDPRLASIELDYVVLISLQDPAEAKRIFNDVKGRTPTFSPIYDRVKRLERSFQ